MRFGCCGGAALRRRNRRTLQLEFRGDAGMELDREPKADGIAVVSAQPEAGARSE